jgi:hypothetical protein
MPIMMIHRSLLSALLLSLCTPLWAAQKVDLDYHVRFLPESDQAEVSLTLGNGERVRSLAFNLGDKGYYSDFSADGEWSQESPERGVWKPGKGVAKLTYRVQVSRPRGDARFDARMTDDWALLRGDDLVPSAQLRQQNKTELVARLQSELPKGWRGVETGWPKIGKDKFRIDNPQRKFDRPTGWIVAGKIGTRRAQLGQTDVTIAAPVGEGMRRMDILTLLTFVWKEAQAVFPRDPAKLLIVGAGDPGDGRACRRRRQAPGAAVRWHEAACRHRPRLLDPAENPAHGRAVFRARRPDARQPSGRTALDLSEHEPDRLHDHA